jgi:hypothetical protein
LRHGLDKLSVTPRVEGIEGRISMAVSRRESYRVAVVMVEQLHGRCCAVGMEGAINGENRKGGTPLLHVTPVLFHVTYGLART